MSTFLFLVCLTAAQLLFLAFAADVFRHMRRGAERSA
jgi:hypothetical protein